MRFAFSIRISWASKCITISNSIQFNSFTSEQRNDRLELGVSSSFEESLLGSLPVGDGPEIIEVSLLVVGYVEVVGVSTSHDR